LVGGAGVAFTGLGIDESGNEERESNPVSVFNII
jgi:hypothetical protein